MNEPNALLRPEVRDQIERMGPAEIVVGIPSFNNARTIGGVIRAVEDGLAEYFPGMKSVLVNSDGGSSDGTRDIVEASSGGMDAIHVAFDPSLFQSISTLYQGFSGKGSAFRTVFEIARALGVKSCAVVDADLRSITPDWMDLLISPTLKGGVDFVAPYYLRHKYDGTITNTIIYPCTRALYGKRIRQPIGGDFGFSGALAGYYADQPVWESDVARFGIDIWMTTTAVANGYAVCQAFLGAKIHDPKDPGADLASMLQQVAGAQFDLMERYAPLWKTVTGSEPVRLIGSPRPVDLEPVDVNLDRLTQSFRLGMRELMPIYEAVLPEDLRDLYAAEAQVLPPSTPAISDRAWARTVYAFALAHHEQRMNRSHLVKSLTPLYLGKVASWVRETFPYDSARAEERLEELCLAFEREKPDLIRAWI